jgi:hypothetical protein
MKIYDEVGGLYGLFLQRLEKAGEVMHKKIIPFPIIFQKLCASFTLKRQQCWDILFMLRDLGFIEIIPYHGVRIC